jgi:hypothetical protein
MFIFFSLFFYLYSIYASYFKELEFFVIFDNIYQLITKWLLNTENLNVAPNQCCGSGRLLSGSGFFFSKWQGPDPDPSLYKICTNLFQQEIFGPKVALKSHVWGKG